MPSPPLVLPPPPIKPRRVLSGGAAAPPAAPAERGGGGGGSAGGPPAGGGPPPQRGGRLAPPGQGRPRARDLSGGAQGQDFLVDLRIHPAIHASGRSGGQSLLDQLPDRAERAAR